jgi:rhodanese-related sulfurtransferase
MSNSHMTLTDFHDSHLKLGKNDVILDVRNRDEYQDVHIKGSLNLPLPELGQHLEDLRKYDHVYIHCKRGGRARTAFEMLNSAGLTNLVCIHDAGMDAWVENGFPIERGVL